MLAVDVSAIGVFLSNISLVLFVFLFAKIVMY